MRKPVTSSDDPKQEVKEVKEVKNKKTLKEANKNSINLKLKNK